MEIERRITIDVPAERAWSVVGDRFHDVGTWASMIDASEALAGTSGPAGQAHRACVTRQGTIQEKLVRFDADNRTLAYEVLSGLPGFVRKGGNTWWVSRAGAGRSEVRFRMVFELSPVAGFFMGWMMKRQMSRMADDVADDLKRFLETGEVSPRKAASAERFALASAA
ncbi:MAG: SRPBCC family protein [Myxococcota bacterium]